DLFDRLFRDSAAQFQRPGEMTLLGIELRELRQRVGVDADGQFAELGELAKHAHRIVATGEELAERSEMDLPALRASGDRRSHWGGRCDVGNLRGCSGWRGGRRERGR